MLVYVSGHCTIKDDLCEYIKQPKEQLELEVDKKATVITFKVKLLPARRRNRTRRGRSLAPSGSHAHLPHAKMAASASLTNFASSMQAAIDKTIIEDDELYADDDYENDLLDDGLATGAASGGMLEVPSTLGDAGVFGFGTEENNN